ncbi:tRNA glutamyl-Q(34) synthetase GluQRS [Ruegeria faecimaris]|uniref:Glutamyl-Q tRNA(Asp) synthetase n=1 Tax=Ruegeria faecimaris TaxID=686389 RepID=A0A521B5I9_9RHOB|nr:tRNA glutamyl-Q(34) synthetase GluQRS [Ruegeria faecimaris]SMO42336.1 glutamyl-Q tRNA(Asp) synthetase [Ruegeria faecimaris]
MTLVTRFAPSPTGPLHLGHAYSAILAHDFAKSKNGQFLLRIEDIDRSRSRPEWETQIYDDLHWLGLFWPEPVLCQSTRTAIYDAALDDLWSRGLLYPCSCNRKDIANAASAPQEGAPLLGPDGIIYPGTCRTRWKQQGSSGKPRPLSIPLRLDMAEALQQTSSLFQIDKNTAWFQEIGEGPGAESGGVRFTQAEMLETVGDVVLSRRDMGTSYHLSVVLDDAAQKVTHVVRGQDLFEATRIHVLLQALLNLPTPIYLHHRLIRDQAGKRLAKRDDARAIAKFRDEGATPEDIRAMVGL